MTSPFGPMWRRTPRLIRFFIVGGVNTLFGYGAYALLLWSGLHYASAALLGTLAGIAFNYFTTGQLVFEGPHGVAELMRFVAVYAAVYLVNVTALAALDHQGVGPYIGGLVLIVPIALLSYALMRRFVFGKFHGSD